MEPDEEIQALRRRGRLPFLVVTWAVVLAAGYVAWDVVTHLEPTRVLVAIDVDGHWFEGSELAAQLADRVNEQLAALGFEPVKPGDPDTLAALNGSGDDLRAAARKLHAGYVVGGRLVPKVTRHDAAGGYHGVELSGAIEVFYATEDRPAGRGEVLAWSGAPERPRALTLAVRSAWPQAVAEALPPLLAHPVVARLLSSDARTAGKLAEAQAFVARRGRELRGSEQAWAAQGERRLKAEKGPAAVTYHGRPNAQDRLGGVGPAGYLVMTEDIRPYVTPLRKKLLYYEQLETLEWRHPDRPGQVLWRGYNVYSYPAASRDGVAAAFVEDVFGQAKALTVVVGGEAKRVAVDPEHRYSSPRPSPAGKHVVAWDAACRDCDVGLLAVRVADGAVRLAAPREGGRFAGHGWADADTLLVLHTPAALEPATPPPRRVFPAERQTLWRIDLSAGEPRPSPLFTAEEGTRLSQLSVSPDGSRAVARAHHRDQDGLGILDLQSGALTFHPVAGKLAWPRLSPDNSLVVFSTGGGTREEIATLPATGGSPRLLTRNAVRDRYPVFSDDGARIYYETLDDDVVFPRRRTSFVASLPVPR